MTGYLTLLLALLALLAPRRWRRLQNFLGHRDANCIEELGRVARWLRIVVHKHREYEVCAVHCGRVAGNPANVLKRAGLRVNTAGCGGSFHPVFEGAIFAGDRKSRNVAIAPGLLRGVFEKLRGSARRHEILARETRSICEYNIAVGKPDGVQKIALDYYASVGCTHSRLFPRDRAQQKLGMKILTDLIQHADRFEQGRRSMFGENYRIRVCSCGRGGRQERGRAIGLAFGRRAMLHSNAADNTNAAGCEQKLQQPPRVLGGLIEREIEFGWRRSERN